MRDFFEKLVSEWWGITIIVVVALAIWVLLSALLYRPFFKRFYDIVLSGLALIVLSPIFLILIVLGAIKMKGNPFFTQMRPGKINKRTGKEKIFKLIKFRTMTCEKDENGNLLPDEKRLTKYGKILRSTSLDELPELINIFIGNMSIVGPRPLLVSYLPYYTETERHRHDVRPGLTGLAQVKGRNNVGWEKRFKLDIEYVQKISLLKDIEILFLTVKKVLIHEGIAEDTNLTEGNFATIRQEQNKDLQRETKGAKEMDEKQCNILLLSVGTRNKIVQYFKKAFKNVGQVVATDMSELAPAIYEADKFYKVPRMTAEGYIDVIFDICKKEKISAVLTLIDPELSLLAKYKEKFYEIGVQVIGSDYLLCERCLNKWEMFCWLEGHGYRCAKTYIDKEQFFLDVKLGKIRYPVFVKPICGSASISISKVYDEETVDLLFAHTEGLMIQEFLNGQEIGVDCYIDMISGEVVSIFTKKKLLMRAGETDKAVSFKDDKLFDLIKNFVQESGFKGQIDIDVFEINGEYYISEVNPRFGGGYPHAFESGCNHMELIKKNLLGEINEERIGHYESGLYMMKYNELQVKRIDKNR